MLTREFVVLAGALPYRKETWQGRPHTVVPVIALVEGVIKAMNSLGPEFVPASEFTRAPTGWNGRPLFVGHPVDAHGAPVSGNDLAVLEQSIGRVFNTEIKDQRLAMEAWIDDERAEALDPRLLARVNANQPIEVSVGVFVETETKAGRFMDHDYGSIWRGIVPDHLALLPEGHTGACSIAMGCGVRAAGSPDQPRDDDGKFSAGSSARFEGKSADGKVEGGMNVKVVNPHSNADKVTHTAMGRSYEGANRHLPTATVENSRGKQFEAFHHTLKPLSAAQNRDGGGHFSYHDDAKHAGAMTDKAKAADQGTPARAKAHATAAAAHTQAAAGAPSTSHRLMHERAARTHDRASKMESQYVRHMAASAEEFQAAQDPESMSDKDVTSRIWAALKEVEPTAGYPEAIYPGLGEFVYVCFPPAIPAPTGLTEPYPAHYDGPDWYRRSYSVSAEGSVTVGAKTVEVEPIMTYQPVVAEGSPAEDVAVKHIKAACTCQAGTHTEERNMTKAQRVAALLPKLTGFKAADSAVLEAMSDEQLDNLEALTARPEAAASVDVQTPEQRQAEIKAAVEAAQPKTEAEFVAAAPTAELRAMLSTGLRVGKERKAATIKALKDTGRCKFADADLEAKSQDELETLVTLAGGAALPVDFSAGGAPRVAETTSNEAPAAPDLFTALKAAEKK